MRACPELRLDAGHGGRLVSSSEYNQGGVFRARWILSHATLKIIGSLGDYALGR